MHRTPINNRCVKTHESVGADCAEGAEDAEDDNNHTPQSAKHRKLQKCTTRKTRKIQNLAHLLTHHLDYSTIFLLLCNMQLLSTQ